MGEIYKNIASLRHHDHINNKHGRPEQNPTIQINSTQLQIPLANRLAHIGLHRLINSQRRTNPNTVLEHVGQADGCDHLRLIELGNEIEINYLLKIERNSAEHGRKCEKGKLGAFLEEGLTGVGVELHIDLAWWLVALLLPIGMTSGRLLAICR